MKLREVGKVREVRGESDEGDEGDGEVGQFVGCSGLKKWQLRSKLVDAASLRTAGLSTDGRADERTDEANRWIISRLDLAATQGLGSLGLPGLPTSSRPPAYLAPSCPLAFLSTSIPPWAPASCSRIALGSMIACSHGSLCWTIGYEYERVWASKGVSRAGAWPCECWGEG